MAKTTRESFNFTPRLKNSDAIEKSCSNASSTGFEFIGSSFVVIYATASADQMADDELTKFFLTLHSITSSYHFFEHLLALFDCHKLTPDTEEQRQQLLEKQPQLRINVINLIKKWTNFHGLFIGRKTLKSIGQFLRRINDDPDSYSNVTKFVGPILELLPKLSYGMKQGILPPPTELPEIPDEQIIFKPTLKITEPSPLEVARQITLLFHTAFKAVHSREFVVALGDQRVSHQTPTLAEFLKPSSTLQTANILRQCRRSWILLRI